MSTTTAYPEPLAADHLVTPASDGLTTAQPIRDFRYPFLARRVHHSVCRIRVFLNRAGDRPRYTVLITELPENRGINIRYCLEEIATAVKGHLLRNVHLENITWVEHHPNQTCSRIPIPHDVLELIPWDKTGNPSRFIFPAPERREGMMRDEFEALAGGLVEL